MAACAEFSAEGPAPEEHPLLPASPEEDALWADVEAAQEGCAAGPEASGAAGAAGGRLQEQAAELEGVCTVAELLRDQPQKLLAYLQEKGVRCLGGFRVEDRLLLGRLSGDSILTMGAQHAALDYERAWRRELGACTANYTGWSSALPVLVYVVTVRGAAFPGAAGLLHPLLRRWQAGGCSYTAFALPTVQAVIDWKWTRFCRRLLLWELAAFLLWLGAYAAWVLAVQGEDPHASLHQLLRTPWGAVAVAADALCLLGTLPFLLLEASSIWAYGRGWLTAWSVLTATSVVLQAAISGSHLARTWGGASWLPVAVAAQCVLLLFRLQYFSRVFRPTRFAFVDSLAEVLQDLKYYLLFVVMAIGGFAAAFFVLFQDDGAHHQEFSSLGRSFVTMVAWLAGDPNLGLTYQSAHPLAAALLSIVFVFSLGLVLMNLLISLMTTSLSRVTEHEGLRMLLSKAQVIDELESTITECLARRLFPHIYPPFLHILRVDPSKMDRVDIDSLWTAPPSPPEVAAEAAGHAAEAAARQGAERGAADVISGPRPGPGGQAVEALRRQLGQVQREQRHLAEQLEELKAILLAQRG